MGAAGGAGAAGGEGGVEGKLRHSLGKLTQGLGGSVGGIWRK